MHKPPKIPMPQPPLSLDSPPSSDSREDEEYETEVDDSEAVSSLTRQLAETAVGVREMSRQLGTSTCTMDTKVTLTYGYNFRARSR